MSLLRRLFTPGRPRRNEAWLSQRLGLWLEPRGPLRTVDDWAMLSDWLAGQLGCDVDVTVLGPATVALTLGPDCPTDERGAALLAVAEHTPRGVWCHVGWMVRGEREAA